MVRSCILMAPFALAALLAPTLASAQPRPGTPAATPRVTVLRENGRTVFRSEEEIIVPGDVQRPYAFAVSGRAALGYTALETRVNFVPQVVAVVRRDPF